MRIPSPDEVAAWQSVTLLARLGITITQITADALVGTMPVDEGTRQIHGLLHGGASVALAETLGSLAATLSAPEGSRCVGIEINANHLRGVKDGVVTGTATPVHVGQSTQVWHIHIRSEDHALVCLSRLTVAVLKPPR